MDRAARKSDGGVKNARSAKTEAKSVRTSKVVATSKKTAAAGSASSAAPRLRVSGTNTAHEKEKLSVTLDKALVGEIRTLSGGRPLSTSINALLREALAQHHLGELVAEMEETAGPVRAEAYERVFSQWFEQE